MEEQKKQGMENLFSPYEESLTLKELGFNEPCFGIYEVESKKNIIVGSTNEIRHRTPHIDAPTFSQAFRFFRETHNTLANVYSNASGFLYEWHDTIGGTHRGWSDYSGPNDSGVWDSYEDAQLACLRKLIEIVKTKK